jgi:hypothetical protein
MAPVQLTRGHRDSPLLASVETVKRVDADHAVKSMPTADNPRSPTRPSHFPTQRRVRSLRPVRLTPPIKAQPAIRRRRRHKGLPGRDEARRSLDKVDSAASRRAPLTLTLGEVAQ